MPTVLRIGSFRFFFFANEGDEPPHTHVQRGSSLAKFWLRPVALGKSTGFAAHELVKLTKMVSQHQARFEEAWHEFHGH